MRVLLKRKGTFRHVITRGDTNMPEYTNAEIALELRKLLSKKSRPAHERIILNLAMTRLWQGDDDEPTPMPCEKCGSRSTDCGC